MRYLLCLNGSITLAHFLLDQINDATNKQYSTRYIISDHPIWNQGIQIPILTTLLGGAFSIGFCLFHPNIARRQKAEPMDIFAGFNQLFQSIIAALLIGIIVLVGFVLLIVPGVIAGLGLSQTYFIMADKPGTSGTDAMQESWDMMRGYKADLFALSLSFVGWTLLAIFFTCGIGMLWVMPDNDMSSSL